MPSASTASSIPAAPLGGHSLLVFLITAGILLVLAMTAGPAGRALRAAGGVRRAVRGAHPRALAARPHPSAPVPLDVPAAGRTGAPARRRRAVRRAAAGRPDRRGHRPAAGPPAREGRAVGGRVRPAAAAGDGHRGRPAGAVLAAGPRRRPHQLRAVRRRRDVCQRPAGDRQDPGRHGSAAPRLRSAHGRRGRGRRRRRLAAAVGGLGDGRGRHATASRGPRWCGWR